MLRCAQRGDLGIYVSSIPATLRFWEVQSKLDFSAGRGTHQNKQELKREA